MKIKQFFLFPFFILFINLQAQTPIRYQVHLKDIQHHEIRISVAFPAVPLGVLEVRMPTASPGRYALHNFAKNVYDVEAFDSRGRNLEVDKANPNQWNVEGHDGFVRFEYTLYGNHADGTYAGIDNRKIQMNMPAVFVYGAGMERRPIELSFDLEQQPEWKVATQLKPLDDNTFYAPNYYYFYDSPTIVGELNFRDWESSSNGKNYSFEIAALHEGTDEQLDDYEDWVKKIVEEEKAIYGELPDYDFGKYTFLLSYNPWVYGDGMEHRNSTICVSQGNLEEAAHKLIGTISHEFFHCWNVERIRPRALEPFDFDRANMSGELWFSEGFTSYYDDLVLCRAGIRTPEEYVEGLTRSLNFVLNAPGRLHKNPIQMSYNAPFVDAATSIDETNFKNTHTSYYPYGAIVALALDLSLRSEFNNLSLDDFMRRVWEDYGKTEVPFQIPDLQKALAEVTGDAEFAARFFSETIYHSELPDFKTIFEKFGIRLQLENPGKVDFASLELEFKEGEAIVNSPILENNSLYQAGLNEGDKIFEINGLTIKKEKDFIAAVEAISVGQTCSIRYEQNGRSEEAKFQAKEDPSFIVEMWEKSGGQPSPEALNRRKEWLKN